MISLASVNHVSATSMNLMARFSNTFTLLSVLCTIKIISCDTDFPSALVNPFHHERFSIPLIRSPGSLSNVNLGMHGIRKNQHPPIQRHVDRVNYEEPMEQMFCYMLQQRSVHQQNILPSFIEHPCYARRGHDLQTASTPPSVETQKTLLTNDL